MQLITAFYLTLLISVAAALPGMVNSIYIYEYKFNFSKSD